MKAAIYRLSVRLHCCWPWPPAGRMTCQEVFQPRDDLDSIIAAAETVKELKLYSLQVSGL
jgi:hypothetical protein